MTAYPFRARRLLFCVLPASGHVNPTMPLALAARDAGHEVAFATGASFVGRLQALGFPAYPVGVSIEEAAAEVRHQHPGNPSGNDRPNLDVGGQMFFDVLARRAADDLLPLLERGAADLVVFEETNVGAPVAASLLGVPAICHALGRAMPPAVIEQVFGRRAAELWAHYGQTLMPIEALGGELRLDIYPASLQQPSALTAAGRIPMRPVPWNEPGPELDIRSTRATRAGSSPALVYLTLGSMAHSVDVMRTAIDGLSELDVDVVAALGPLDPSALGSVPEHVHVERFVDQAAVLPRVDLVVHHGGSATMLSALSLARPQLLLPYGADQFNNADAVIDAGIGRVLEPAVVSANAITDAANELLAPGSHRSAMDAVSREIAALPHPRDVLPTLVDLA